MDRKQIDSEHVIPRYLAGQLNAAEDAAFEEFAARNPDIYRDVERVLKLKEGLAVLQAQQKLDSLLRVRRSRPYLQLAAAAAVVLIVCGALLWFRLREAPRVILAAATADFVRNDAKHLPLIGSYVLIRSRNLHDSADLQLPQPRGVAQLRVLPSSTGGESYAASLMRLTPNGQREVLGSVTGLKVAADLYVTLYVDSVGLSSGDYEISLAPEQTQSSSAERDRFVLRVP